MKTQSDEYDRLERDARDLADEPTEADRDEVEAASRAADTEGRLQREAERRELESMKPTENLQ